MESSGGGGRPALREECAGGGGISIADYGDKRGGKIVCKQKRVVIAPHGSLLLWISVGLFVCCAEAAEIAGPLRQHPENGRYFTDGTTDVSGAYKAIFLTGSHTWSNLIDRGPTDPPAKFDFNAYLDLLQAQNHNFIRMWSRHVAWYHEYGEGELFAEPLAWERTGPGKALDGKPKFDLAKLNENYFMRLRARVKAAGDRGIY